MLLQSSGEHKAGAFFTELCQKEPRAPASAPGKRCEHRARVGVFAGWRDLLHGQPWGGSPSSQTGLRLRSETVSWKVLLSDIRPTSEQRRQMDAFTAQGFGAC